MTGKIVFRILSALVLIAAIAGIGFMAYQAGVAQGSPITIQAPEGQSVPAPYYPGYGMPFHHPFGFGFGCFGILFTIFLMVLALKAFRFMVFGPRFAHHMGMHGPMRHRDWGERGFPPMAEEWHKKMHEAMDNPGKPEDKQA